MDLTGYVMELETLINRCTILFFVKLVPIVLLLLLTWGLPYPDKKSKRKNKPKTKRKIKSEKEEKRKNLIGQIVVSVLLVSLGVVFVHSDVVTLSNLKKDMSQNSFAVYEGEAYLSDSAPYLHSGAGFDLIVDTRFVEFENRDETYRIDMSETWEGITDESGSFSGKITYAENSKYILKIE
ncbi:MAG: hypothetical protein J6D06_03170 [Clostridia bacterium]|nr:hypothetical protein [Clostridia bacterium]